MGFLNHVKQTMKTLAVSPLKHLITGPIGVLADVIDVNKKLYEEEKLKDNTGKVNKEEAINANFKEAK